MSVSTIHSTDLSTKVPDPYRVFFPLGILVGIVGVALWPVYAAGWIENLRTDWHIDLQLQGFLLAFVLGFLLTALPRFSQTAHATAAELTLFVLLFIIGNSATACGFYSVGRAAYFFEVTLLLVYAIRRFRVRKSDPPDEFIFVGVGLLLGWSASLIRFLALFTEVPPVWELAARRLITEGMMLLLVLGVGGKLAPLFFGHATFSPIIGIGHQKKGIRPVHLLYGLLALALVASFPIEYGFSQKVGLWIRALASSAIFLYTLRVHRSPKTKGVLVHVLRYSLWFVALSPWGAVLHPQYRVETLHVMLIAGFGSLNLTIATRVILSHGNHPMELEQRSMALVTSFVLLVFAMLVRSLAGFWPDHYFTWLGAAGILWISGLILWGSTFIPRAIRIRAAPKS